MAFDDKTFPIQRHLFGNQRARGEARHILSMSFGYTQQMRRASNGTATGGAAAVASSNTVATTTNYSPAIVLDVPRAISITSTGTAGSVAATAVVVTGTNIEGKVITESLTPTAATLGTVNGTRAFKTITKMVVPIQTGTGVSYSIGTLNVFGLNHRLPTGLTTANVRIASTSNVRDLVLTSGSTLTSNLGADGIRTLQAAPTTLNVDPAIVELNTFVPAIVPNGLFHMTVYYYYPVWHLDIINDATRIIGQLPTIYGVSR